MWHEWWWLDWTSCGFFSPHERITVAVLVPRRLCGKYKNGGKMKQRMYSEERWRNWWFTWSRNLLQKPSSVEATAQEMATHGQKRMKWNVLPYKYPRESLHTAVLPLLAPVLYTHTSLSATVPAKASHLDCNSWQAVCWPSGQIVTQAWARYSFVASTMMDCLTNKSLYVARDAFQGTDVGHECNPHHSSHLCFGSRFVSLHLYLQMDALLAE